jgi:hypothetical protein
MILMRKILVILDNQAILKNKIEDALTHNLSLLDLLVRRSKARSNIRQPDQFMKHVKGGIFFDSVIIYFENLAPEEFIPIWGARMRARKFAEDHPDLVNKIKKMHLEEGAPNAPVQGRSRPRTAATSLGEALSSMALCFLTLGNIFLSEGQMLRGR